MVELRSATSTPRIFGDHEGAQLNNLQGGRLQEDRPPRGRLQRAGALTGQSSGERRASSGGKSEGRVPKTGGESLRVWRLARFSAAFMRLSTSRFRFSKVF